MALFPERHTTTTLHLFSGSLTQDVRGIRLDRRRDVCPDLCADALALPLQDQSLGLVVADPPYTAAHAARYGGPMPSRRAVLGELARVVRPGGHVVWLDVQVPMHRKDIWHWWGCIGIIRSTNHVVRVVTCLERTSWNPGARENEADPGGEIAPLDVR